MLTIVIYNTVAVDIKLAAGIGIAPERILAVAVDFDLAFIPRLIRDVGA